MKKILFILHYAPAMHGAAMMGEYVRNSKFNDEHFENRYINLGTSLSLNENGKGSWKKGVRYLKIIWSVLSNLLFNRPNLAYLTMTSAGIGFYKDAIIALLVKLFGVKIVYHFHNKGVSTRQHLWFDNILYKLVFYKSEVILLSPRLYYDIQKYVPEHRVHYCDNGIPRAKLKNIENKVIEEPEVVQILSLSNLYESKGIYKLLEACKILQDKGLPFHCTFVGGEGDISKKQFRKKVKSLKITKSAHFAGRKYGAEKDMAYRRSDIFVLFTSLDCFPLVLLEAMNYSLPVVSTYEGAIPDIVDENSTGFLVKRDSPQDLAKKLEILIKDESLRERMGKTARRRYEKEFTLESFERRFTDIIKRIA